MMWAASTRLALVNVTLAGGSFVMGLFGMNLDNTEYILPIPNFFSLLVGATTCLLLGVWAVVSTCLQRTGMLPFWRAEGETARGKCQNVFFKRQVTTKTTKTKVHDSFQESFQYKPTVDIESVLGGSEAFNDDISSCARRDDLYMHTAGQY